MREDRRIAGIRGDVVDAGHTAPRAGRVCDDREDCYAEQGSAQRASTAFATRCCACAPQADRAEHEREQAAETSEQEQAEAGERGKHAALNCERAERDGEQASDAEVRCERRYARRGFQWNSLRLQGRAAYHGGVRKP